MTSTGWDRRKGAVGGKAHACDPRALAVDPMFKDSLPYIVHWRLIWVI